MPRNFDKEEHTTNYWRAMSLKVDSAVAAFHSQLSSILEKLVVFALEEIKALAFEYCEELSQEKRQNRALSERIGADQDQKIHDPHTSFSREPQDGNNDTGSQESTLQLDSSEGEENEEDPAEGQHVTLLVQPLQAYSLSAQENFFLEKFDQVDTVCPENPSTDHEEEDCSQSQEETEHSLEPQFCCEPPEDSKELLRDCKQTVEATSYNDILPSEEDCPDVEFQIKREAESPDIKTELQMQTAQLESGAGQEQLFTQETMLVDCEFAIDAACPQNIPRSGQEEDCGLSQDAAESFCWEPSTSEDHHSRFERKAERMTSENRDIHSGFQQMIDEETTCPLDIPEPRPEPSALSLPKQHSNTSKSKKEKKSRRHWKALTSPKQMDYKCDFCNKTFAFPSQLKRHRLKHTKERTHICGMCGRGFVRKFDMHRHEMLHLNPKPYLCVICGYSSSRSSYMKLHLKQHKKRRA